MTAPALMCVDCDEAIAEGDYPETVTFTRDAAGAWVENRLGPTHRGECFRTTMSVAGMSEERAEEVLRLRRRAQGAREAWHGSAGEKGPGL